MNIFVSKKVAIKIVRFSSSFGNKKVHYALCAETFCHNFPYDFYFGQPSYFLRKFLFLYKKIMPTKYFFHSKERSEKNFFTKE